MNLAAVKTSSAKLTFKIYKPNVTKQKGVAYLSNNECLEGAACFHLYVLTVRAKLVENQGNDFLLHLQVILEDIASVQEYI